MDSCKFSILISFIFTFMKVLEGKLTSSICTHDKPQLQFPFKFKSICQHNQTLINFQQYGYLGVKSISHNPNKLTLIDPKDCVFEVFLNLNPDSISSPFRYYHSVKNYTYLNCSNVLDDSLQPVPCLSDSNSKHHVYVVETSLFRVPSSCMVVKIVLIPFAYSSFVSDDSFGLDLTWDSSGFQDFVEDKRWFGLQSIGEGLSLVILVLVIVGVGCVKLYCWKKSHRKEHEWEMLLGDVEIL